MRARPRLRWQYSGDSRSTDLTIRSDVAPVAGRLFHVEAPTLDFRDSRWSFDPMELRGKELIGRCTAPASGHAAVFGEVVFEMNGERFTLSTQIRILGGKISP